MDILCKKWIVTLLDYTGLKEDDEQIDVYVYGLLSLLYSWIPFGILCIISICWNVLPEMILWHILFTSFRKYTGGYHAPHPVICFICSILLGISCIVIMKIDFLVPSPVYYGILVLSLLVFFAFSPVTKKNFTRHARMLCKTKIILLTIGCTILFTFFPAYQIILLHAVSCTILLCIVEKYHK